EEPEAPSLPCSLTPLSAHPTDQPCSLDLCCRHGHHRLPCDVPAPVRHEAKNAGGGAPLTRRRPISGCRSAVAPCCKEPAPRAFCPSMMSLVALEGWSTMLGPVSGADASNDLERDRQ